MEHSLQLNNYRPGKTYGYPNLFRELVIFLCFIGFIYAIAYLWVPAKVKTSSWLLPVLFFVMTFFEKTGTDRLVELTFDTVNKEVVVSFKSMFSKVIKKPVPFDQARVEIEASKQSKLKIFEPITLYLLNGKKEVFAISKTKDRLSVNELRAIVDTAERQGIAIIRK